MTLKARKLGEDAAEVAASGFFENAVRLHREGEGTSYTGLKPSGFGLGPVVIGQKKTLKKKTQRILKFLKKRFRKGNTKKNSIQPFP